MGKLSNEIIAASGGIAQEEWLRDESEHPYKFVPTKASGNTVPFPAITKCNTFILRHYAASIVEEIGQRMYDGDLAVQLDIFYFDDLFTSEIQKVSLSVSHEKVTNSLETFIGVSESCIRLSIRRNYRKGPFFSNPSLRIFTPHFLA